MSVLLGIMGAEGGTAMVRQESRMVDHNGVLTMQRLLLAGALGLSMAQKAAAILEGEPDSGTPLQPPAAGQHGQGSQDARLPEGAVLRAILDAANECLGLFDDRPPGERWCDALFHLLDLAAFAADLDGSPALSEARPQDFREIGPNMTQRGLQG
jgi:hypothetical protein